MPTVKFSDNPNEETAFVTQDGGQRNRAVLTAALDGTIKYSDNPNSTKVTVTVDGVERKAVAVVNIDGSGGGDQHNLGWYATESALTTAHATATDGDWAIVGATDTVWVWDSDSTGWKDTGAAGIELPDQTGHSGEFLMTDGSSASWSNKPLVNTATGNNSLTVGGIAATNSFVTNIGKGSNATANVSTVIGYNSSSTAGHGIAIGIDAKVTAQYAIQIGGDNKTNSDTNTFKVANANGNYEIMSADGTIPEARLADTTNAQQGDVLTLDSNGNAVWQAGSGGGLQNTATGTNSLTVLGTAATSNYSVNIGSATSAMNTAGATVVGCKSKTTSGGQVFGYDNTVSGTAGVVVAQNSTATNECSCVFGGILNNATANYAIQIGGWGRTNSDANTLKVGNANGNFELMSADGTIPTARLTKVNSTTTLTAAGWSNGSQTVTVTGMTATGVVLVSPDPTDQSAYTSAGIWATAQAANSLTFTATTTPSADIDVNVVML